MSGRTCSVEGCTNEHEARGWCHYHYARWRRTGTVADPVVRKEPVACSKEECDKPALAKGLCDNHYHQHNRNLRVAKRPERPKRIVASTRSKMHGYVLISGHADHPNAQRSTGLIFEHRFVMSEFLERPLRPEESVHHRNGVRDDNRIENLELWITPQQPGQRVVDLVAFAREILERYANDAENLRSLRTD